MKKLFTSKTLIALAVAVAAAAAYDSLATEQPIPPPASASALPDYIAPGSPVAQVLKLAQAGVDANVIHTYIVNCPTAFNLDADKIIVLTDAGVTSDMVNDMFAHDKNFLASIAPAAAPAPTSPPPTPTATAENNSPPPAAPAVSAPPAEISVNDFNNTLSPYGQWVEVDGYGRCWRPTAVAYDPNWQPYCDRGHWVYTDCGWYWNSDYSWGVTFHYGRWFNTPQYGWCWWPDTVWAPSWVTWRSSSDYCGWAPLPPYTAYQPGVGFTYHGGNVSVSFGFGLAANCFTFVSIGNFCESHPRYYCLPQQQVTQIYNQTTIINNYNCNNRTIVNNGVSVTVIGAAAHHPIQAVSIGTIGNAGRHGWRGQGEIHPARPLGAGNSDGATTRPLAGNGSHHDGTVPNNGVTASSGNHAYAPTVTQNPSRGQNQHETGFTRGNVNSPVLPTQNQTGTANNSAPTHNQSRNNLILTGGENHPTQHPYTAPSTTVSAPMRGGVSAPMNSGVSAPMNGNVSAPVNNTPSAPVTQHSPAQGDFHQQLRQMNPQSSYTAPAPVAPSQRFESHQNYSQSVPRSYSPAAPVISAPAQNQNGAFNGGGHSQNWMVQNH